MPRLVLLAIAALLTSRADAEMRRIRLPNTALLADALRGRIYATTPGSAGLLGNRVVAILPDLGAVATSSPGSFVGSEPALLAMDDRSTVLYVGLRGAPMVSRVRLDTLERDLTFDLGAAPFYGPLYAGDLAVMPGAPGTVAVALAAPEVSPEHQGIAVYDEGVGRPVVTPGHTGSNTLVFGRDPGRLYGLNTETSESAFRRMSVGLMGVTVLDVTEGFPSPYRSRIEFDGAYVLTMAGTAIDPERPSGPVVLGTYPVEGDFGTEAVSGPVESDPARDRVYYVHQRFQATYPSLLTFARSTFTLLDELPLPQVHGAVHSLVRWGDDGLAFGTTAGDVFLVASRFAPCSDASSCDDGDACTADSCNGGTCAHGPVTCGSAVCTTASCDPVRGCVVQNADFEACMDDGDPCTLDYCEAGACTHPPAGAGPCADDGNPCTVDVCRTAGCMHEITDPGISCTDEGDACTDDVCDGFGGCIHTGYTRDLLDYYVCAAGNVASVLVPEPPCAGKCRQRLEVHVPELAAAAAAAERSAREGSADCHAWMRRAVARATTIARTVRRAKQRGLLEPGPRGIALVRMSKTALKRLRAGARRVCPVSRKANE